MGYFKNRRERKIKEMINYIEGRGRKLILKCSDDDEYMAIVSYDDMIEYRRYSCSKYSAVKQCYDQLRSDTYTIIYDGEL